MKLIGLITIITLIIAGLFHFYWAFGGKIGLDRAIPTKDGFQSSENIIKSIIGRYRSEFCVSIR